MGPQYKFPIYHIHSSPSRPTISSQDIINSSNLIPKRLLLIRPILKSAPPHPQAHSVGRIDQTHTATPPVYQSESAQYPSHATYNAPVQSHASHLPMTLLIKRHRYVSQPAEQALIPDQPPTTTFPLPHHHDSFALGSFKDYRYRLTKRRAR